jgi:hypothetical protein
MKLKLTLLSSIVLLTIALVFIGIWYQNNSTTLSYVNDVGEVRSVIIPAIPGVDKTSQLEGECSNEVAYDVTISQVSPLQASPQIKEMIKPRMQAEGWVLQEERKVDGFWEIVFTRQEERLYAVTGAIEDLPTVKLIYQWPPCSHEK